MRKEPDQRRWMCVLICAVIFCGLFFYSGAAWSADAPVTYQPDPGQHYQGDLFCPYNYDGLTGRVVHCIQAIVIQAARDFLAAFMVYYEATVITVLILAMTIYGAMIAMGTVQRPTGQTFFFLFKLAAVGFFTLQFSSTDSEPGRAIVMIFDIMQGLLNIVTNYVTVSQLSACSDNGHLQQFFGLERANPSVWDKVDCLFITMLGIGVAQTTAVGLIAVLSPLVFTGGIGIIIIIIAFFFMLTLLVAVMRAIKIYLASVIVIAFLICVSPLIIPLLLFNQTRPIFDKWLKNLVNYMLIPIFLFAYLAMIVAAYDAIIFKGRSSLYYAIASEASEHPDFNFKDWIEVGASGKVQRYEADHEMYGQVVYEGEEPALESGTIVGRGVPGVDALTLMQYQQICACLDGSCSQEMNLQARASRETCDELDDKFDEMIECALNPKIPSPGMVFEAQEDHICLTEGLNYYGFLRSEEALNFAIAPNTDTDAEQRKKQNKGCGWNPICHVGKGISKAVGFAFDVVKNIVGAVARVTGVILQGIGNVMKGIGAVVGGACRITPVPGGICDAAGGVFMVSGSVVHATGTFVNFSGRVLMNGLLSELGELFDGWFDVQTFDLQKVASYRCKVDKGITNPKDPRYLNDPNNPDSCPGPKDIVMDILYVMITAAAVAYLMLKWLNYIPSLGKQIIGAARIEATLPGEGGVQAGVQKVQHGFDRMIAKRRSKGRGQ